MPRAWTASRAHATWNAIASASGSGGSRRRDRAPARVCPGISSVATYGALRSGSPKARAGPRFHLTPGVNGGAMPKSRMATTLGWSRPATASRSRPKRASEGAIQFVRRGHDLQEDLPAEVEVEGTVGRPPAHRCQSARARRTGHRRPGPTSRVSLRPPVASWSPSASSASPWGRPGGGHPGIPKASPVPGLAGHAERGTAAPGRRGYHRPRDAVKQWTNGQAGRQELGAPGGGRGW